MIANTPDTSVCNHVKPPTLYYMLLLYINGKNVVIKDGTNFKLTRNNPLYSQQSDYTFDVTLPLSGCHQNQEALGLYASPQTAHAPLQGKKYTFRLIAPPIDFEGTAIVTQVTEKEAKVQLLAESDAEFSNIAPDASKSDVYIDTLSLGYATPWSTAVTYVTDGTWEDKFETLFDYKDYYRDTDINREYNKSGGIQFPFWRLKQWCRYPYVNSEGELKDDFRLDNVGLKWYVDDSVTSCGCHPGLLYILQKVLEEAGYTVTVLINDNNWLWHIYILNVRGLDNFETMLPHWTVEEFTEQVRLFLNLWIKYEGQRVTIRSVAEMLENGNYVELAQTVDEYTTDVDDSEDPEQSDPTMTNVGYELPYSDDIMQIPDEVWQYAEVITLPTYTHICDYIDKYIPIDERGKSKWIFIDAYSGYAYAFLHNKQDSSDFNLTTVDFLGPLIRHGSRANKNRTIDTNLKIVPCRMAYHEFEYYDTKKSKDAYVYLPLATDENAQYVTYYNIDKAINSEDDGSSSGKKYVSEKVDYIEVFYAPKDLRQSAQCKTAYIGVRFPTVVGTPYAKDETTGYYKFLPMTKNTDPFNLNNRWIRPALHISANVNGSIINTAVTRNVTFIDNIACDPAAVYRIHGRRYVCQKLELTFDINGLQPLKVGYFHEIN